MYKDKGFVGGAVFNPDFSVSHFISNNKKDLPRLRSSKYLQSSLEGFYTQVKNLLGAGERVLVCGCPCQMAALRASLGKDYDNLIIVDFICRGINSPKVWHKFLDSFEERYGSKVVYAKPKNKEYGWRNLTQKVILENGKHLYETRQVCKYTIGYLQTNAYCRPSCYQCKFKGYPRMADITLADFWGVEHAGIGKDKNLGTSLVMVNSTKGQRYFERIQKQIVCRQVPFETILSGNKALNQPLPPPIVDRKQFFEDLDKMTFTQLADKYIHYERTTWKHKVKKVLSVGLRVCRATRLHPKPLWQFFTYNSISDMLHGNVLIPTPYCVIRKQKGAMIQKRGITILGNKPMFPHSKLETRLLLGKNAILTLGPNTSIGYGADIEIFEDAHLTFEGEGGSNIGLTVICGEYIEFGKHTMMGRHVTVRDNNGSHYINRKGYKNSSPVIVGEKVWLCESCTVMNGVKIGDGAIVGAKSFVIRNVPAHTMVSGHPAEVVDEEVYWKC
jgi:acetyltransferase-like isoleucine patch superfamily enzyme/coenzyme F420-reducing hydrogenase beta subunit